MHGQPVDLQAVGADLVEQGVEHPGRIPPVHERRVDHVHAQPADRLLLERVRGVEQPDVEDEVARLGPAGVLEPDRHPAVAVVAAREGTGRDRVGEGEEPCPLAAGEVEPLPQERELVVEHLLDALPRHVPWRLAVDRVAEGHVVGRHGLGDRARGPTDREEPAGHLLAGADLGERAVDLGVEIEREGPLGGRVDRAVHRRCSGKAASASP